MSELHDDLERATTALEKETIADYDELVAAWEHILCHPDFPISALGVRLPALNNAGIAYLSRYRATRQLKDLERALELWQKAVEQSPFGLPESFSYLSNLGLGQGELYNHTRNLTDLEQAIQTWELSVQQALPGSAERFNCLVNLSEGLRAYYDRTRDLAYLRRAIQAYEHLAGPTHSISLDIAPYLNNLGNLLRELYTRTGDQSDLERAIQVWEQGVNQSVSGSTEHINCLGNLGKGLRVRYDLTKDLVDLQRAIQSFDQVIELIPLDSPHLSNYLSALGNGLRARYAHTGDPLDLERAIQTYEQAVKRSLPGSPARPGGLNNLGIGLKVRYERTRNLSDLERAIQLWEEAVKQTPFDFPDWLNYLSNLGNGLQKRYEHTRSLTHLDQVIQLWEEAVKRSSSNSSVRVDYLNKPGIGLRERYEQKGNLADLVRAIQLWEEAVNQSPLDSPHRQDCLNSLAIGLRDHYHCTGELSYLKQAIQFWKEALERIPDGSPALSIYLSNLGNGFRELYKRTGELADLELAIETYEQAAAGMLPDAPNRLGCLNNLGLGLRTRYTRTRNAADLDRAIQLHDQAVKQASHNSFDRHTHLNSLANALRQRYELTREPSDLDQATQLYEQAISQIQPGSVHWPGHLNDLGVGLVERYARREDPTDLDRAIQLWEEAVKDTLPDSPELPVRLNNLGKGLRERYMRTGNATDKIRAVATLEEACKSGIDLSLEWTLQAARNWGYWALERKAWDEVIKAYAYGIEASELLFQAQLLRAHREIWLREAQRFHAYAAYALAQTGDLHRAVETVERGRARLLSQVLERDQADLTQMERLAPTVYKRYVAAINRLQVLEIQDVSGQIVLPAGQTLTDAIRQARADLEAVVEVVRRIPGYEEFLKPPSFEKILYAAGDASLIYISATPVGGLALIVSPIKKTESIKSIFESHLVSPGAIVIPRWLDDLTANALNQKMYSSDNKSTSGNYLGAYTRWRNNPGDNDTRTAWFNSLEEITHWLWDVLMGPLVDALTSNGVDRAILIPQGLLGLLPLHAAWAQDNSVSSGRRYALDTVTFSYAPNALALTIAKTIASRIAPDELLTIDEPSPVRASKLYYSEREVAEVRSHFVTVRVIHGKEATRARILAALSTNPPPSLWHFSCHGAANFTEPLASGLLVADDELLTLRDLLTLHLSGVHLAVLSACETGIPGGELPDEVIGLPTGLLQAGVAGVMASLWSVSQLSTMLLLVRFYDLWRDEGLTPIEVLRQAQLWVRDTTNKEKADYFKGFSSEFAANKTTGAVADELYKELMMRRLEQRDFAHPFYWAAFSFTGV